MVFMKYCENFEYSKALFNPILPFKYMKKSFKDAIFVALKFILVNMVTGMAGQLILMVALMILVIIAIPIVVVLVVIDENILSSVGLVFPVVMVCALVGIIPAYIRWITQLAYMDNLEEVYVDKFLIEE